MRVGDQFGALKVVELTSTNGGTVGLADANAASTSTCIVPRVGTPSCDALGRPTSLTFRYTGGGCGAGNNDQEGKAGCVGGIDPGVSVTVFAAGGKGGNNTYGVAPFDVAPGETFTMTPNGKFDAESVIELSNNGSVELLTIHTSCSKQLEVGDIFGSLTLVAFNDLTGGNEVVYTYEVSNTGDTTVNNITVEDNVFGSVPGSPINQLAPGEVVTLTAATTVLTNTINLATVFGEASSFAACQATDETSVTLQEKQPEKDKKSKSKGKHKKKSKSKSKSKKKHNKKKK